MKNPYIYKSVQGACIRSLDGSSCLIITGHLGIKPESPKAYVRDCLRLDLRNKSVGLRLAWSKK